MRLDAKAPAPSMGTGAFPLAGEGFDAGCGLCEIITRGRSGRLHHFILRRTTMTRLTVALLAAALLVLPGCFGGGPSEGWHKKEMSDMRLDVDLENCEWDAVHQKQADGNYVERDISDEEFDAFVNSCMQDKGYKWGIPEPEGNN